MFGISTWKYSVFVLYARLIFTCGQWNRWCERRICYAWWSRARLFLSTFWQDFICVSCCICWVLNRGIGYRCGADSTSSYTSHSKTILIDNPVCFIVQCIFTDSVCALILTHASRASSRHNQQWLRLQQIIVFNHSVFRWIFVIPFFNFLSIKCQKIVENIYYKFPGPKVMSSNCLQDSCSWS